ncbi:MAG: SAM-dependent methyltransferase [Leptolyngbya sp. SIO4C1]|nr:SAM-dependent methyltransferase [Leptolyngbya sp. SIO4C1]
MPHKALTLSTAPEAAQATLYDYLLSVSLREPDVFHQLRQETAELPGWGMQIAPDQGQFMALLLQLISARKVLEIGTFTGYSTLWLTSALPDEGTLITCDVDEEATAIARRYWQKVGLDSKISLRLAPAADTLDQLLADGQAGTFDFAFIDADKVNYDLYYEKSLQLLRPGGLAAIDNTLWFGRVIDPEAQGDATAAIRALNQKLHQDSRVSISLVGIGDGLTLTVKR